MTVEIWRSRCGLPTFRVRSVAELPGPGVTELAHALEGEQVKE